LDAHCHHWRPRGKMETKLKARYPTFEVVPIKDVRF
jgi:hypothetical protein